MFAARGADHIVLRMIGVENLIAHEVEQGSVQLVRAGLQLGIDATAAGAPEAGVVGVGHHLELLNGVDVGGELEAAGEADGSTVEAEAIRAGFAAAHGEVAVGVPAAGAGKAGGAELFLGEEDAGREVHEHVDLAAVEGEFAGHAGVEIHAAGGVAVLDQLGGIGGDGDFLGEVADLELEGEGEFFGDHQGDRLSSHFSKAGGFDFDAVGGGLEIGQGIEAFGVGGGGGDLIGALLGGTNLCSGDGGTGGIENLAGDGGAEVLRGGGQAGR